MRSVQEALCHRKPVVIVSVFGDQAANAKFAERKGFGVGCPFAKVTEENLLSAIRLHVFTPSMGQLHK